MSETTNRMPTTDDVRYAYIESAAEWYEQEAAEAFDRWLAAHDAEIRAAALEEAATLLEFPIDIQVTNGVGWIPTDSRAGAARYLRHLARAPRA